MAKKKTVKPKTPPRDFESAMADIETIVAKLESGELNLTESLEQYEQGIKHLRQCHQILEVAEQKVTLLSGFDVDGNPVTQAMPETQFRGSASGTASATSKRSKGGAAPLDDGQGDSGQRSVDDARGLF